MDIYIYIYKEDRYASKIWKGYGYIYIYTESEREEERIEKTSTVDKG